MELNDWAEVLRGKSYEADLAQAILGSHGIPAEVLGNGPYTEIFDESRVFVPKEHAEAAARLLAERLNGRPPGE